MLAKITNKKKGRKGRRKGGGKYGKYSTVKKCLRSYGVHVWCNITQPLKACFWRIFNDLGNVCNILSEINNCICIRIIFLSNFVYASVFIPKNTFKMLGRKHKQVKSYFWFLELEVRFMHFLLSLSVFAKFL